MSLAEMDGVPFALTTPENNTNVDNTDIISMADKNLFIFFSFTNLYLKNKVSIFPPVKKKEAILIKNHRRNKEE